MSLKGFKGIKQKIGNKKKWNIQRNFKEFEQLDDPYLALFKNLKELNVI